MKKSLVSALTTALVVGAASTTFAAANPFADVPADHWAYDAVAQLAEDGVINGYGDDTFRGERNITRYEMAQMVAKAMAKEAELNAAQKAQLDKLAAEFSEELNNLGVRVSNLEKYSDKITWSGKVEYTYQATTISESGFEDIKGHSNGFTFRLEPKAEINDHWFAKARIDADWDFEKDGDANGSNANVSMKRAWVQGDYDNFTVKLGRQELNPVNERGMVFDTDFTGAALTFGKDVKATINVGNLNAGKSVVGLNDGRVYGINVQYDKGGEGFYAGAGYNFVSDDDFMLRGVTTDGVLDDDTAKIWSVNAGYRVGLADIYAGYAHNTSANQNGTSWQVGVQYGNYDPAVKGSWNAYIAYRQFGLWSSLMANGDDALRGTKGVALGAAWAPFKNIGVLAKYYKGSAIEGNYDADHLWGRVEFLF